MSKPVERKDFLLGFGYVFCCNESPAWKSRNFTHYKDG